MQELIDTIHRNLGRFTRELLLIGLYVLLLSGSTANANWNQNHVSYTISNEGEGPRLTGHVQNWATLVQNYILQLASDGLKTEHTQSFYDLAEYTFETKHGNKTVDTVKNKLGDYFIKKQQAAQRIADKIVELHDEFVVDPKPEYVEYFDKKLSDIPKEYYKDADIPERLIPEDMVFSPYFKQKVTNESSVVKISDEVPRSDAQLINTTLYSEELEELFKENARNDSQLRWQYFGSVDGLTRFYPGREWSTNFVGFYTDYDPRVRPWYIGATSGPKDVVIVLDCSYSMSGKKFEIAKSVARTVLSTLTKQDYVNIVCARASHWDGEGKWHYYKTEVMSCKNDTLVPASASHRKDLMEKTSMLEAGGTSELKAGFETAFELLRGNTRTGCQALIVLVTDGRDTDGDRVRCDPGYYTRSGYVPGAICKYSWKMIWDRVAQLNAKADPKARIFSYMTIDKGEELPGRLACKNNGSLHKLDDGENLISQMSNYFEFLSKNTFNKEPLWTAPYLDAWGLGLMVTVAIPAISKVTGSVIGVVGVDATLDEIENIINNEQWGNVYAFLIDNEGATIFHPRMKASSKLMDDPMFIPISKLEQVDGKPEEFLEVQYNMTQGHTGSYDVEKTDGSRVTYYYTSVKDSVYSFAFVLNPSDQSLRRAVEPENKTNFSTSYFNLLIEYSRPSAREKLPGEFEKLDVKEDEEKYPNLRVSYLWSSFRLAPKCYCNPNEFLTSDDLTTKTIRAHKFMNSDEPDAGCEKGGWFEKNTRADVLITSPIENVWKARNSPLLKEVKWTYIGCRSGVFRTYPGHRSSRAYDPTKRPWYKRVIKNPDRTSMSMAYMDAAGVGKIISISQAVYEGMPNTSQEDCQVSGKKPPGCECHSNADCQSGYCYKSAAYSTNTRCSSVKVEAVTSLDLLYTDFHHNVYKIMKDPEIPWSCGNHYKCPNGEPGCQTRCYLFDVSGNVITDPVFLNVSDLNTAAYNGVALGTKEGEIMHELIYKHKFFVRKEQIDFQGTCSITKPSPRVSLEGLPKNPEESDAFLRTKGPIPSFSSKFSCIQDIVVYSVNESALGPNELLVGNVSGPCKSGYYYVTALPKTNLYMLVIENWRNDKENRMFNFNCKITNRISATGAFRIINGTCAHNDDTIPMKNRGKCPKVEDIKMNCTYQTGSCLHPCFHLILVLLAVTLLVERVSLG
ncbi:Voltage-dependent calcium channel subunit alpha-2/delta-2 [Holothuria leucospilota]|uniref:Voltage-dependent calcium channel subunit alpha-2/delta-2 n=1 Tax=Holothuria leucospilota TaxID=206669 RepID=A0A9Q1BUC3_HOLLE|nr:Voltage-dependent calcium channel subunit alpha-2/delta-2 [Holothuria leucospilota]